MLESKHRNDRIQREQMRKLKDCYVSSLKTMREDLTKSEQRRLERMEIAWKEKEARLNTEWKERFVTWWFTRPWSVFLTCLWLFVGWKN